MSFQDKIIEYTKVLLIPILGALFTYFGQSNNCLYFLQSNLLTFIDVNSIPSIKDVLLVIGILLTVVPSGIKIILIEEDKNKYLRQREFLIRYVKKMFISALESKIRTHKAIIKIRIFVPLKVHFWTRFINRIMKEHEKTIFRIKYIEGLSDNDISENLQFEVNPSIQGLVGLCYKNNEISYEPNLLTSKIDYHLDHNQSSITFGTKFCLCIPIYNNANKIVAIMSLDSNEEIIITQTAKNDVFNILYNFGKDFNEQIPDLF